MYLKSADKWFSCYPGMVRPQVADGENYIKI
jgi:hypothetical protein